MHSTSLRFVSVLAIGLIAACGTAEDDMVDPGETPILEPPPDGEGFQLAMTTHLDPGVEVEHCMFVQGPPETFYIARGETRYTGGSHHVLLFETPYTTIPTMKNDGTVVDTSGVFDCTSGATDGWSVDRVIGGSQDGDGASVLSFPPGVAMEVPGNRVLMINAHYINASDQPAEPEVRLNVWTIPQEEVTELGDVLFIYNPLVRARAEGTDRARWQCPVHQDITLINVQSHMHARGVGYEAALLGDEPFYTNELWENVPVGQFEGGMHVPAGSVLDYFCEYANSSDRSIYQGPRTTDEMCMLIGSYYPADRRTANCLDASGDRMGGVWVGEGTASCADSWSCITTAASGESGVLEGVTDCVLAADPAVAVELSATLACAIASENPITECAAEVEACEAM